MKRPLKDKRSFRIIAALFFVTVFIGAVLLAHELGQNPTIQAAIADAGYLGVVVSGIVAGLNVIFPVPAATLAPLFLAAGLSAPFIVLALAFGTLIADFTGYALGHVSRNVIQERYPKTYALFSRYGERRSWLVYPFVLFYAAFVPFPNEAILIPMAVAGFRFGPLIIPLFVGNLINQAMLVYGISAVLGAS